MTRYHALREHFAALGYDLSQLSDAEIDEGLSRLRRAVARLGLSADALIDLGAAARNAGVSLRDFSAAAAAARWGKREADMKK